MRVPPPTIVSNIDRRHSYETALAYAEAGSLVRFSTGLFFERFPDRAFGFPVPFADRLGKRSEPRLPAARVDSVGAVELAGLLFQRYLPAGGAVSSIQARNVFFDWLVARRLEGTRLVHGFDTTARLTFEAAKRAGLSTILDEPTPHPDSWREILARDCPGQIGKSLAAAFMLRSSVRRRKEQEIALADLILVPSTWCRDSFIRAGVSARKLAVAPYGIDRVVERPPEVVEGRLRILSVASQLGVLKGTHHLLEAFGPLAREAELWLVGPAAPDLVRAMTSAGGSVRYLGPLGRRALETTFTQVDIFALPSLIEGSSLAVLEAMGHGLPVVVTDRCGSPVDDGAEGFVIAAGDVDALTERFARLRQPQLRAQMGCRALARGRQQTWVAYREAVRDAAFRFV